MQMDFWSTYNTTSGTRSTLGRLAKQAQKNIVLAKCNKVRIGWRVSANL